MLGNWDLKAKSITRWTVCSQGSSFDKSSGIILEKSDSSLLTSGGGVYFEHVTGSFTSRLTVT